jgi:hypothetical protein
VLGSFPGAVLGTGSLSPRTIPITGNALVCVLIGPLPPCGGQFDISFGATQAGQRIGGGVGGVFTFGDAGTAIISVHGAPWTVATVTVPSGAPGGPVGTIHSHGFAHGPVSLTGSTLLPGGVLQIVTPTRATGIDPPSIGANGAISRILVHVVPEPGRLLLLVSGAALVAWLGWRRRP